MRSDAAPAIPQCSASTFGACKVDGTTITASGGVISSSGGSGSGPGTWTGGGNSATGVNSTAAFGNGFVVTPNGASGGTATVNTTVVDNTKTTSYSVAAGDMANALNLNGTLTLTLPAASSTIFAPGMTVSVAVQSGTVTVTNSTGLTAGSNFPTSLAPGSSGTFVANADGTHLDFFPGQVGVAAASHQFVNSITASGPQLSQPAFTDVSGSASVAQIGGSAASHAVPVDVAGTSTYKVVPDCQDSGGNHINYTQSTDAFSCGTSGGGSGALTLISTITSPVSDATNCGAGPLACFFWTGLSTYRYYDLKCYNLNSGTNGTTLSLQIGEGATTWKTTGYFYANMFVSGSSTVGGAFSSSATGGVLNGALNTDSVSGLNVALSGMGTGDSFNYNLESTAVTPTAGMSFTGGGYTADTTAKTAVRVVGDHTLNSGVCSLWGRSS